MREERECKTEENERKKERARERARERERKRGRERERREGTLFFIIKKIHRKKLEKRTKKKQENKKWKHKNEEISLSLSFSHTHTRLSLLSPFFSSSLFFPPTFTRFMGSCMAMCACVRPDATAGRAEAAYHALGPRRFRMSEWVNMRLWERKARTNESGL